MTDKELDVLMEKIKEDSYFFNTRIDYGGVKTIILISPEAHQKLEALNRGVLGWEAAKAKTLFNYEVMVLSSLKANEYIIGLIKR